jgi:hypothetical protein
LIHIYNTACIFDKKVQFWRSISTYQRKPPHKVLLWIL